MNLETGIALVTGRPWLTVVLSFVVMLSLAAGAQYIVPVDFEFRNHFSKDDPRLAALEEFEDTYAISDTALVAIAPQGGTVFTQETLIALEELTERLWQTPYATRVDSLANYTHSEGHEDELIVEPLIDGAGSLSDRDIKRIRKIALDTEEISGRLVSRDGRVAGLVVSVVFPEDRQRLQQAKDEAVDFLYGAAADARSKYAGIEYHLTGTFLLNRAFRDAQEKEFGILLPVAFGTMLLVVLFMLRSIWGTVAIVLTTAAVILSGLGFAGWAGMSLYGESAAAWFVLMAVTVAHSMHISEAMLTGLRQGLDRKQAAARSVKANMWPVFLTSATTAVGFLSLNFSDMPPFRVMGNIVAFGTMCAFVYSVTFLPALLSLTPMRGRAARKADPDLMDRLGRFVVSRRTALLGSFAILSIALVSGISQIELNHTAMESLDDSYEFRRSVDFVSENFSGLEQFEYSLDSGRDGGVSDVRYLDKVDRFGEWYRSQPEVSHVFSIADIVKRLNKNLNGDDPEFYRIPDDSDLAAQFLLLYEFSLPVGRDLNNLIDVERSASRITVALRNLSINEKIDLDNRAQAWLRNNAPDLQAEATGIAIVGAYSGKRNIEKMLLGTITAMSIVSLLLVLVFRSLRFGLISLIPNFVPAAMAMGLWGYAVGQVGIAGAVVTAMAFGIIVDDTIHFLTKYLRAREEGLSPPESVQSAFRTAGKALLATTVVFALGFQAFAASGMTSNQTLGSLLGITVIAALLADFLFLPPLLMALDGQENRLRAARLRRFSIDGLRSIRARRK